MTTVWKALWSENQEDIDQTLNVLLSLADKATLTFHQPRANIVTRERH